MAEREMQRLADGDGDVRWGRMGEDGGEEQAGVAMAMELLSIRGWLVLIAVTHRALPR